MSRELAGRAIRRIAVVAGTLAALALLAVVALVIYGGWRSQRAIERFTATLGPPEPQRFVRPELAEAENAATWLVAGARAVALSDEQRDFLGSRASGDAAWTEGELALAAGIVEDNGPALELLRRAAGCTDSSFAIDYRQGADVELPPLVELLTASSLLWVDARLALAAGETKRLRMDLATIGRLADSLSRESSLVTALIATAVDRHYLDLVHRLVSSGGEERELLADAEAALGARDREADYLRSLAAEATRLLSVLPEDLPGAGGDRRPRWVQARLHRLGMRLATSKLLDEYSALAELVALPWPEIEAASERRLERGLARPFAVSLYPNLIDSLGKLKAGESVTRLALEAVRQRLALLDHGAYRPARATPRVDPYTGEAVRVEQRPDGTLLVEAPGAAERWRARHPVRSRMGDPPFIWILPAAP